MARCLTIIKNARSEIKFTHFGNELPDIYDDTTEDSILKDWIDYFLAFCKDKKKLAELEKELDKTEVLSDKNSIEYSRIWNSNRKKDIEYVNAFWEARTSVKVLDKIIELKPDKLYYRKLDTYIKDTIFSECQFEIDYGKRQAKYSIRGRGSHKINLDTGSIVEGDDKRESSVPEVETKKKDVVRKVTKSATGGKETKEQCGRVNLW